MPSGKIDGFLSEEVRILQDNPKRMKSADRYDRYRHAKTLGQVLELGGSRADIANDVTRGFIVLRDKKAHKHLLAVLNDKSGAPAEPRKPDTTTPAKQQKVPSTAAKPEPPRAALPPSKQHPEKKALAPPPMKITKVSKPMKPETQQPKPQKNSGENETLLRKRAAIATEARARVFGRTVGKGRMLPIYPKNS